MRALKLGEKELRDTIAELQETIKGLKLNEREKEKAVHSLHSRMFREWE